MSPADAPQAAPPKRPGKPGSLRRRLIVVPTVVVCLAIAGTLAMAVHQARLRVVAERAAAADLADHLVRAAVASLPPGASNPMPALSEAVSALPDLRHLHLFVVPQQGQAFNAFRLAADRPPPAPRWFVALLRPPPWEQWRQIGWNGRVAGYVVLVADPYDEIAELWSQALFIGALFGALLAVFIALVWWTTSQAMRPLRLLAAGLERLERQDFEASLPPLAIAELAPLRDKFNSLAKALNRMVADNRMLLQKLVTVQENERKTLAHELHDELGPCLFAIKAQAALILRACTVPAGDGAAAPAGAIGGAPPPVAEHARTVTRLVDDLQRMNRRILERLRPVPLAELGLAAAIGHLVADWQERAPQIDWRYEMPDEDPPVDGDLALTLYRVAQECLTNAARHAQASSVTVELGVLPQGESGGPSMVHLAVRDDGCGFGPAPSGEAPAKAGGGFGLLGIRERVAGHGGAVRIGPDGETGTAVVVSVPLVH